ncbi:hypothetical protein Y887_10505 [Xanthomonas pisi DSM 18956]|uniref:Uncharacterized protein n=2 Tax=Xanthomonas pisi TaxID=56457 RepID=A0A2S7CQL2_9XANT|nr:hypothetical protein Y887_10505 [Xanthomonas pisi DSM 18956]PPU63876.1 hypothetical protein XpiCFBP4643_22815 [Xanthomonas pisi]
MQMAEQLIYDQAEANLPQQRFNEMKAAAGKSLFVAGNYPGPAWEQIVGFVPAQDIFYQVTIGIAVDPGQSEDVLALALISRDVSNEYYHIVWHPTQQQASTFCRPGA